MVTWWVTEAMRSGKRYAHIIFPLLAYPPCAKHPLRRNPVIFLFMGGSFSALDWNDITPPAHRAATSSSSQAPAATHHSRFMLSTALISMWDQQHRYGHHDAAIASS